MSGNPAPAARLADAARLFNGRRLTLARQVAGLRKNALAEKIGKTPTAIASYENGSKRPAPSTVAELSLTLGVDPSFFLVGRADESVIPTPHFRSLRSTTQVVRDQAHAYGCLVHEIAMSLERYVELPLRDVPRIHVSQDDVAFGEAETAASAVRSDWGLGLGPAGHLVRLFENHGVLVVFSLPQAVSVDAFSIETDKRPLILLNPAKDDYFRQRFDLAHELGHVVMHADAEPGGRIVEDQANRFAAEFLMPAAGIRDELPARIVWPDLFALKERWGVSIQALLMRSRQLKVMNEATYQKAMVTLSARGWRRQEPGEGTAPELPSLLARSLELLEDAGYSALTLATQSRVPVEIFRMATARQPTFSWHRPLDQEESNDMSMAAWPNVTELVDFRKREHRGGAPAG